MAIRITRADLESAIKNLDRAAMSAGYDTPNGHTLAIEIGSRTNGIAYRVTYLPTGDYAADPNARRELCPLWSQGVVGRTATEAYHSITTMTYALDAISRRQNPTRPRCATLGHSVPAQVRIDHGPESERVIGEPVCVECATSYLARPALSASLSADQF